MHILSKFGLIIPICFLVALLILLVIRGLQQRFRWFLIYVIYTLLEAVVRLIVSSNKYAYYVVYWGTSALAVPFTFLAVRESFLNALGAFAQIRWLRRLFWICIGFAATYSLVKVFFQPRIEGPLFVALTLHGEQLFQYLICAVTLFFFGAVHWFNIRKYQWESWIMLGFLANAILANFGTLTHSVFGTRFRVINEWLPALAYIIGSLTWVLGFSRKEYQGQIRPPVDLTPEQILAEMDSYKQYIAIIRDWLRRN